MSQNTGSQPEEKSAKLSLIKVLYIYPIAFFLVGLTSITAYYTWLQVSAYQHKVSKLKAEYPAKQKTELRMRVLLLKDYISWVKTNGEAEANMQVGNYMKLTSGLLSHFKASIDKTTIFLPEKLKDSIQSINKTSSLKIVLLDKNYQVIFPENLHFGDKNITNFNINNYKRITYNEKVSAFSNSAGADNRMIFTKSISANLSIGIVNTGKNLEKLLQDIVIDSLSKIKYNNNDYVFVNNYDGFALLSKGVKHAEPIDIKNNTEANWKKIFEKELEYAKTCSGGFYTYYWRDHANEERSEKMSYFSGIQDWEWIIGTGMYTSNIKPIIDKLKADLKSDILKNLVLFTVFMILLSLLAVLTMRYFALKTKSNMVLFLHFFRRAAQGMQIIDTRKLAFTEFKDLARAANQMIEERERIKSILSDEKARLRYMIDAIPDLIFFKDTESRFLGCNKAFEKYVSKSSSEIAGLTEFDLFSDAESQKFISSDKRIIQSNEAERTTNWIVYPNGQKYLYYTLKTPYFDSENNLLGIIGISRDITEMEETRQRLILAKEKAEESDRLKTAFLANMSHEIRTPMNAIIGFSDLLAEDDLSHDDKVDFIGKIKSSGRALMGLINDIIDIAKIEAGQLKVSESTCDVNAMLRELHGTFDELKNSSGKRGINIELIIPEKPEKQLIITDPMRLQQILTNLLSNALKFTEFGGIEFGYVLQPDFVSFYVKDSGIGILRSKQKLLFQRFSQLDPSTTRKYGGTGLGLAISKNLVDLLGGTIGMESSPGKGSTFYFTIPYKPGVNAPVVHQKLEFHDVNWQGKTILIAEDILQNFLLMEAILKRSEVRLLHAVNGQIAIDMVKAESSIDLILMDIQLPIKTGYEALKEILEIKPHIPVMSYTAFALPHEREKSLTAGFVDFIPKPIKVEIIIPMLDKYLHDRPNLSGEQMNHQTAS